jgi:hypothetical protein
MNEHETTAVIDIDTYLHKRVRLSRRQRQRVADEINEISRPAEALPLAFAVNERKSGVLYVIDVGGVVNVR